MSAPQTWTERESGGRKSWTLHLTPTLWPPGQQVALADVAAYLAVDERADGLFAAELGVISALAGYQSAGFRLGEWVTAEEAKRMAEAGARLFFKRLRRAEKKLTRPAPKKRGKESHRETI